MNTTEKKQPIPDFQHTPPPPPKPFPFFPLEVSNDELKRRELMMELDKWSYNDQEIAKRTAVSLVILIAKQFEIDLKDIK